MNDTAWGKTIRILIGISLFITLIGLSGCWGDDDNDDYDSVITVCNRDNVEYTVKLHKASDGTVVDQFKLAEWYDSGNQCDDFNDYNGEFFITIHKNYNEDPADISFAFYIEEGEHEHFFINSDGEIVRD